MSDTPEFVGISSIKRKRKFVTYITTGRLFYFEYQLKLIFPKNVKTVNDINEVLKQATLLFGKKLAEQIKREEERLLQGTGAQSESMGVLNG